MNLSLLFAFLTAAIFGFMNVFDTFIVKRRVKHLLSFAIVSAITNVILGIFLALFLDWSNYSFSNYLFPILAGVALGIQLCFYYIALTKHDVSHASGLIHIYPLIVAFFSFLFLNEKLSLMGYAGIVISLMGVLLMSVQIKKLKITLATWSLVIIALTAAFEDFFIKLATFQIGEWHGAAISSIAMGLVVMPLLLKKSIRKNIKNELKNSRFTFISEILALLGITTLYLAMTGLSATIVSVIAVTQPLFVLVFEWFAFSVFGIKIVQDIQWKHKLFAILFIVIGIILLYVSEIA